MKTPFCLRLKSPAEAYAKSSGDTVTDDTSVQGKCHIWFQKMFHVLTLLRSGHSPGSGAGAATWAAVFQTAVTRTAKSPACQF